MINSIGISVNITEEDGEQVKKWIMADSESERAIALLELVKGQIDKAILHSVDAFHAFNKWDLGIHFAVPVEKDNK